MVIHGRAKGKSVLFHHMDYVFYYEQVVESLHMLLLILSHGNANAVGWVR